jgi:Arc/MetJ-type ribon-helix-helix transcriptional regulator
MSRSSYKKVNFLLDESLERKMKALIPTGERSRVINEALRKELLRIKRERATERLMNLRVKGPKVSTRQIVEVLRRERYKKTK